MIDFGIDIPDEKGNQLHRKVSCIVICSDRHDTNESHPTLPHSSNTILDLNQFNQLDSKEKMNQILKFMELETQETLDFSQWITTKGTLTELHSFHEFQEKLKCIESVYENIQKQTDSSSLLDDLRKENDVLYHELNSTKEELNKNSLKIVELEMKLNQMQTQIQTQTQIQENQSLQVEKELELELKTKMESMTTHFESLLENHTIQWTSTQKQMQVLNATQSENYDSVVSSVSEFRKMLQDLQDKSKKTSSMSLSWMYIAGAGIGIVVALGMKTIQYFI